jgi:hypothetical protein
MSGYFQRKKRKMKRKQIRWMLIAAFLLGWQSVIVYGGTISLTTGIRYDVFDEDMSKGSEVTIPVGVSYEQEQFSVYAESAYSAANVEPENEDESSLSTFTDTHIALSYLFLDLPVGIRFGLDINLPTGKERLDAQERLAEAGERHDLFEVDDFGEGLNIGASFGLLKEFGRVSLLVDGGYIFSGEFDPTSDIPDDTINPGDQILLVGFLNWQMSSEVIFEVFGVYSHFLADQLNGEDNFREGEKISFGSSLELDRIPFGMLFSVQYVLQGKDEESSEGSLQKESENSNGDEMFTILDINYELSPSVTVQLIGDVRHYGESERKDDLFNLPISGKRIRYAMGPGVLYKVNNHITCTGLVKYFKMEQEQDLAVGEEDNTYEGVNLAVGMTYTFF